MKNNLFQKVMTFIAVVALIFTLLPSSKIHALETSDGLLENNVVSKQYTPTLEDSFSNDKVIVTLKPGFGGLNKAINFDDFAEADIILEQDVDCNTDVNDKIVISSVDDLTYLQNPETIDNDENYLQILSFNLKDKSKANVLKLVERIRLVYGVLSAEPEYIYTVDSLSTNDSFWNEQWGLLDDGVDVSAAWNMIGDGGTTPTIKVGIFEAGVQMDHPDLRISMLTRILLS